MKSTGSSKYHTCACGQVHGCAIDGARARGIPRVLHIDADASSALVLSTLLIPEAHVTSVPTLEQARRELLNKVFSLVVIDPSLPDGDAATLLPFLAGTPMLVYAAIQPDWRPAANYLPKPWTSARQLWVTISGLLGIDHGMAAGD